MSISLNYTFEENDLVHLSNIMFPFGYLRKEILYSNFMNTRQKFETLYTIFFADELIADITPTQRVYRFYNNGISKLR